MAVEYSIRHKDFTRVHCALVEAARKQQLVTYMEVRDNIMGLRGEGRAGYTKVGKVADLINEFEHEAGRPMLSALLVQKDSQIPGRGFFIFAIQRGHDFTYGDPVSMRAFWESERDAVYKEWAV